MATKNLGRVVPKKGVDYFTEEDIQSLNIPKNTSDLTNDSSFVTETYVKNEIANAQLGGGESGEIDLSGYATKDELHNHSNKDILDNISSEDIEKWNAGGNVDLSEYATTEYVDNVIASIDIPNSSQNVTIFSGKTASFYGDSLTEKNWHYTKGYHEWVKELLGLASYGNYGVSGYNVSDVYNKVTATADSPDIVFVMCGVNDQTHSIPLGTMSDNTTETTYGSLNLLCEKLKEKYPTSIVVFITPHFQTKYPHNDGITSYEVSKAVKEVCEKYCIPVYDNFILSGIYSTNLSEYTTDNCHWNDKGHEMVGKNLASYVLNTFRYLYSDDENTGNEGDNPDNPDEKVVEITSDSGGKIHLSLYATKEDIPSLHGKVEWGITMEPLNFSLDSANNTGGFFQVDVVNDLNAGMGYGVGTMQVPTFTVNDDGTYTIVQCYNNVSAQENTRNYWCFPIQLAIVKGKRFILKNEYIRINGQDYPIHAIGGAFANETISIT